MGGYSATVAATGWESTVSCGVCPVRLWMDCSENTLRCYPRVFDTSYSLKYRSNRTRTTKRRTPSPLKRIHDALNTTIHPQPSGDQRSHCYHCIEQFHVPTLRHEASHPAFCAVVMSCCEAGGWIEAFVFADGVALDGEAGHEEGWEGVGELHDAEGGDEGGEGAVVGGAVSQWLLWVFDEA